MKKLVVIASGLAILFVLIILLVMYVLPGSKTTPVLPTPTPFHPVSLPTVTPVVQTNVAHTVTLVTTSFTTIPGTGLSAKLLHNDSQRAQCDGCTAITTIQVKQGTETTEITYKCGDLIGCEVNKQAFGYNFELLDPREADHVIVKVTFVQK